MSKLLKKGLPFIIAILSFCLLFVYFFKPFPRFPSVELFSKNHLTFFDALKVAIEEREPLIRIMYTGYHRENPCCGAIVLSGPEGYNYIMRDLLRNFKTPFMRFLFAAVFYIEFFIAIIALVRAFIHLFSKTKDYSSKIIRCSITVGLLHLAQWFIYILTYKAARGAKISFKNFQALRDVSYNIVWFVVSILALSILFSLINKRASIEDINEEIY